MQPEQTSTRASRHVIMRLAAVNLVTLGSLTAPVVAVMP